MICRRVEDSIGQSVLVDNGQNVGVSEEIESVNSVEVESVNNEENTDDSEIELDGWGTCMRMKNGAAKSETVVIVGRRFYLLDSNRERRGNRMTGKFWKLARIAFEKIFLNGGMRMMMMNRSCRTRLGVG